MKKLVFLMCLLFIGSMCMAQRPHGGSTSRGGGSHVRTSTPARSSSVNRGSISRNRNSSTTYSPSRNTTRNSANYNRSTPRNSSSTVSGTPTPKNGGRNDNNRVYTGTKGHGSHPGTVHHGSTRHRPGSQPLHHTPHGMHPAPPMHHPIHHGYLHMHYRPCHHWMDYNMYWYGYWAYVHAHSYDQVVVYVKTDRPTNEIIAIATDEYYVYTIYKDTYSGETFFVISDQNDNVLVKTQIDKRYCRIALDENGIWLLRHNDRKPIYYIYSGGNLYLYEQD